MPVFYLPIRQQMSSRAGAALTTPDGRYLVVKGTLWRLSNPELGDRQRQALVDTLMDARREVKAAKAADDIEVLKRARASVHAAKVGLGERGPVWWRDGAPDYTRRSVANSPYAEWFDALEREGAEPLGPDHT